MDGFFLERLQLFDYENSGWDENSILRAALKDGRLSTVYHNNYNYIPETYKLLEDWTKRKKELREQILVSAGLLPMPDKCDLNPRAFDRLAFDGFTIEKVMFESYPGFYVTGNLYRPSGKKGPFPAILNAHGHWKNGRLEHSEITDIPTRCANFALMGFIAFAYDMLGFQDSRQVSHLYGGLRQELWNIGAFGVQLWNSIRCLDFLETLPDVDVDRIGCTGASGGGTQTFFISAIDERIKAAIPVNMISTFMQGGCNCEIAPGLHVGTNNVEITSLTAPRPMLLVGSTGDWTKNTPVVEYPAIRSIYELYGSTHQLEYFFQDADHNYNKITREKVYNWFARKLQGSDTVWREKNIDFGDVSRFGIFAENEKPEGVKSDMELFEVQKKEKIQAIRHLWDDDKNTARVILRTAMNNIIGISQFFIDEKTIEINIISEEIDDVVIRKFIVGTKRNGEEIPVAVISNKNGSSGKTLLLFHPDGKKALADNDLRPLVLKALERGYTIVSADLFLTGEFNRPGSQAGRDTGNCKQLTTFNRTDIAFRIQDIITVCKHLNRIRNEEIILAGLKEASLWCLAAMPHLAGLKRALLDIGSFDFTSDSMYFSRFFLPGFLAAGGFESCIRLFMPVELELFNETYPGNMEFFKRIYGDKASMVKSYKTITEIPI